MKFEDLTLEQKEEVRKKAIKKLSCTCECHIVGENIMHFMECCPFCYQKWRNPDGSANWQKVYDVLNGKGSDE